MSQFETLFGTARALLLGVHGTAAVPYTAVGAAAAVNVTAIVGAVAEDLIEIDATRQLYRHREISVSASEVATPARGDRYVVDGEAWTHHERLKQDGGMVRIQVVRAHRAEHGGRAR